MRVPNSDNIVGDPESGIMHGGVVTTLLDSAGDCAVLSLTPTEHTVATLNLRIDLLQPTDKDEGRFSEINRLIPDTSFVDIDILEGDKESTTVIQQTDSNTGNRYIPAVHGGGVGGLPEHTTILKVLIEGDYVRFPKIVNLSVEYLRPCLATQDTFARVTLFKQGAASPTFGLRHGSRKNRSPLLS